jgi:hypothetical protein
MRSMLTCRGVKGRQRVPPVNAVLLHLQRERQVASGGVSDQHQLSTRDAAPQQRSIDGLRVVERSGKPVLGRKPMVDESESCLAGQRDAGAQLTV